MTDDMNVERVDEGLRDQDAVDEMAAAVENLPTYVSLIGATGSGKSALAQAIATEYDMDVVDDYATDLAEDMQIALGFYASYVPNLMVAMEREKATHKARITGRSVITVGSLIENISYGALQAEYHAQQITTPQQQQAQQRELVAMQVLGCMIQDCLIARYHHFFYLKLPQEIIVPGAEPKFDNATRSLDNAIGQFLAQTQIPVHELTGTLEQQMASVKETIGALATS